MNLADPLDFPCSIKSSDAYTSIGGSAANQAIAAARCGAKTSLIGAIGNDLLGKTILDTLRREGIASTGIAKKTLPTSIINSIIDMNAQKASITLEGANADISTQQIPSFALNEKTTLLLQNDVDSDVNITVLKRAKECGGRSIMCINHANNLNTALLDNLDMAIINENIKTDIEKQCFPIKDYIVAKDASLGGTRLATHTNGCFDAFCGCFAACIQAGMSIEHSIEYAEIAAELTTKKAGAYNAFPYLGDIEDHIAAIKSQEG